MYTMIPMRRTMNPMMNSLFDDSLMHELFDAPRAAMPRMRVDIRDQGESYLLEADLPGVEKDAISINVEDDVLTIAADLNTETKEEKENGYVCRERRCGHVERSFNLEGINPAGITAEHQNGVLKLTLPKLVEEKKNSFRIAIGEPSVQ